MRVAAIIRVAFRGSAGILTVLKIYGRRQESINKKPSRREPPFPRGIGAARPKGHKGGFPLEYGEGDQHLSWCRGEDSNLHEETLTST